MVAQELPSNHDDNKIRRLARYIENQRELIASDLSRIVKIPSVSPKYPGESYEKHLGYESKVAEIIGEIYKASGVEPDFWEYEPGRKNVGVRIPGTSGGRSLLFNGHTDVVPPGTATTWAPYEPFSGHYDGTRVWGRGSSDMKAGLIAQAYAIKALRETGITLRGDLLATAVVGEESMDHTAGTTSAIQRGYTADAAIVAEPSSPHLLAISPSTAGMWWLEISIEGKRTHASMRGESIHAGGRGEKVGVNALDKAFLVYSALTRLERQWAFTHTHPDFPPGHFSILPGAMYSGPKEGDRVPFQLADIAILDYLIWYPPDVSPQAIRAEVSEFVSNISQTDMWLKENPPVLEWKQNWPASYPAESAKSIIESLQHSHRLSVAGTPYEFSTGAISGFLAVCDATFLTESGVPAVVYGPGDIGVAHADNESANIDEIVTAAKTFAFLAIDWCGEAP